MELRGKHDWDEALLASILYEEYGFLVSTITYIPLGTSAFSYKVTDIASNNYFLKMFASTSDLHKSSNEVLDAYLHITWRMYDTGIFQNLTYPLKTKSGFFRLSFQDFIVIVFNFIEGKTLKESSPSREVLPKIAEVVARLHKATPELNTLGMRQERFQTWTLEQLDQCLAAIESAQAFPTPSQEALAQLILPNKEHIVHTSQVFRELCSTVKAIRKELVYCHGDLWAGNIILQKNKLYLLDWEQSLLAPTECDLTYFIGDGKDFAFFLDHYERHLGRQVLLQTELLRYYLYRRRLTHLNFLMRNILFTNTQEAKSQIDLATLSTYYIPKLDKVDAVISKVKSALTNHIV